MESDPIAVLVADDHEQFLRVVQAVLEEEVDLDVIGTAENGERAVDLANRLAPDVVLMDISMPVMDGFSAAEQIARELPGTQILFLTGSNSPADVSRARSAGGSGYVTKDLIASELVDAIITAGP